MSNFKQVSESFDNTMYKALSYVGLGKDSRNDYISAALSIILVVYASLAAPKLPISVAKLFDYVWFKVLIFFLIALVAHHRPVVAIIAAVAVMISIQTLNLYKINSEMMAIVGPDAELGANGIPPYVYSIHNVPVSGKSPQPSFEGTAKTRPSPNPLEQLPVLPVAQVPDEELRSLCQKMFVSDEQKKFDGVGGSNLSAMLNSQSACKIANHQFDVPTASVAHTAQVTAFDPNM